MKPRLWTKNFCLITGATSLGAAGGILSGFALSFLVFDETGSTLAAALIVAIQVIPYFILPLFIAPLMDRLPRKPFLVGGDLVNGVLYAAAGLYLFYFDFSYAGYLLFSLLLSTLGSFDELAYNSFYPKLLTEGTEEKAYTVSAMLYPVLKVITAPLAAVLYGSLGVASILLIQAGLSVLAALIESRIKIKEEKHTDGEKFSVHAWWGDIREAASYLRKEKGLRSIYSYMAMTNGVGNSYSPILIAFFRTAPGFTVAMYSLFSLAEFAGRTVGGFVRYLYSMKEKHRFPFIFSVYQTYEAMDMCLLWLPYPLMLVNRAVCGFLGINSATLRQTAVQKYLPEHLRARINAYESMLTTGAIAVASIAVGALGEVLDYRLCVTICGGASMLFCWLTVFRRRKQVKQVFSYKLDAAEAAQAPAEP